jgi:hypothetical protein
MIRRPTGWVEIEKITDGFGREVSKEKALKYGWISLDPKIGSSNLFVDQGRQLMAYAFGFRSPIENYTCQRFGVGTGTTAARVTDVALEAPVELISSQATTASITSVDFLTAFVMRIGFSIALGDANGALLTEFGLFSGNNTLLARKVRGVGINKTSDFSPTLTWRIRF